MAVFLSSICWKFKLSCKKADGEEFIVKYVRDQEWLLKNLHDQTIRIVDCRFSLAQPEKGKREYLAGHLPGAVFFDLEKDLSGPVEKHGGRHPLPDMKEFVSKLEAQGIDETKTVVAYDGGEGSYAARFWWLLHYLGHEKVFVLDGGYQEWMDAGLPITTETPVFSSTIFQISLRPEILAEMTEVKAVAEGKNRNAVLIDSREEKRYLGVEEPIDKKAGHIPAAINKPWMKGMEGGRYKAADLQKERFRDVSFDQEVIVYCGSGVTACPNFLALKEAGYEKVKLYIGSFSDWISYEDNKIQ